MICFMKFKNPKYEKMTIGDYGTDLNKYEYTIRVTLGIYHDAQQQNLRGVVMQVLQPLMGAAVASP